MAGYLNLYSYIFFIVRNKYIKWGEEDIPGIYAIGVITLLQAFFVSGLVLIVVELYGNLQDVKNIYGAYLALIIFIINYWLIYAKNGKDKIISIWENKSVHELKRMKLLMILHFVISIGLMIVAIVI